jgi:hypothetical protein
MSLAPKSTEYSDFAVRKVLTYCLDSEIQVIIH